MKASRMDCGIYDQSEPRPEIGNGDGLKTADAMLSEVLDQVVGLTSELQAIGARNFHTAPAGSQYLTELNGAISRAVLDWVERWPL